jgi:hypothetical protein
MTPINLELYDDFEAALTGEETNPYGTTNETVAYHGGYYVDYYEADKILRYEENDLYHSPDDFFYDAYTYSVIEDATVVFQEFIDGKLEGTSLPTSEFENYKNHPGLKQVPGATTYRIMINGTGTLENLNTVFPDATWVPEPLLANQDFKMAMYHALDRGTLATDILKTRTENMFLFTPAYLVDAELGVPYRSTDQGVSVGEGLSPSTLGYNFDAARAYYLKAVAAGIEAGDIVAGTAAAPTVINIELNNYANSESWDLACEYIKTAYEAAFQDDENHVNVTISIHTKDFPGIYYDYMMIGEFDLSVGGISGSTLDAASFLDTYCSDNRGGFTLNWGIDTSIAEIEVVYNDFEGNRHREMWSFDSITSALNGEVYISEGEETDAPAAKDIEVTPTTVSFTIDQFDNTDYENITYTMQWYDNDNGVYVDVDGKVDVPATAADITVTGLLPFYYGYDNMGVLVYQGDYQIVIEFGYTLDAEKEGQSISNWFEMGVPFEVVADSKVADMTSVVFGMTINQEDVTDRALSSLVVYTSDAAGVYTENTTAVVDITDLAAISVTGLDVASTNRGLLTFSDGTVYWISLSTKDIAELAADVVADTTAELSVALHADYTGTVTSVIVYLKSDDSVVGTVDAADLAKILVTGLTAETEYYFEVVFSDAEERMVEFTTTATPAA